MGTFGLLVVLIAAGWRSASTECGEQCVGVTGIVMMPELCADNWGFAQVHIGTYLWEMVVVFYIHYNLFSDISVLWWLLWTRDWPITPV